jgi:DNA-binding FadR family transcriptional regulator
MRREYQCAGTLGYFAVTGDAAGYPSPGMGWAHEMGIGLDPRADVPLGVQLDWALRAAVAAGTLRPGDRLPALRDLAEELGVNHNTVRAAVARLELDGVLDTRHGAGTFVAAAAPSHGAQASLVDQVVRLAGEAGLSPRDLAAALYVSGQAPPEADAEAAERRALRAEIAVLERVLADIETRLPGSQPRERPHAPRGARLLSAGELRELRDGLVHRLAAVQRALEGDDEDGPQADPRPAAEKPRTSSRRRSPRPGVSPA